MIINLQSTAHCNGMNQWESAVDQITDYNQLRIEPAIYF